MNKIKGISILLVIISILALSYVLGHTGSSIGPVSPVYITYNSSYDTNVTIVFADDNTNISGPTAAQFNLTKLINITLYDDLNGTWSVIRTNTTDLTNPIHIGWDRNATPFDVSYDGLVTWNVKFTNSSNAFLWLFSSNQTYMLDFTQIYDISISEANNTIVNFNKPTLNMSYVATDTPLRCCLLMSNNSNKNTFAEKECKSNVVNNTVTSFGGSSSNWELSTALTSYRYFFECNRDGTNMFNRTATSYTLRYAQTAPVVVVTNYSDGFWSNTKVLNFTFVVNTDHPSTCQLWGEFNNSGDWALNQSFTAVKNGTTVPFKLVRLENNWTGVKWGYRCNDSYNQLTSANYTIYVDTTTPDEAECSLPANSTRGTDRKLNLTWTGSSDRGFANYTVYLFNSSRTTPLFKYAITSNSTLTYKITDNLTSDMNWFWNVSVTDLANNRNISNNCLDGFNYYPDSVGYQLYSGYNFYSEVREKYSASGTCNEPSTTPTSVSQWNLTDNSWVTHVCGTATNNFTLIRNDPIVINMPSDAVWERGRIWAVNTTVNYLNISNVSGVSWNLVGVFNDITLQGIETGNRIHSGSNRSMEQPWNYTSSNYTIPWISYMNHTQKYVTFKNNWTYNGATQVFDGDAVWLNLNGSIQGTMFLNRSVWG